MICKDIVFLVTIRELHRITQKNNPRKSVQICKLIFFTQSAYIPKKNCIFVFLSQKRLFATRFG